MPVLRRGGRVAEPRRRTGRDVLSPAVRLLAAPGVLLAAALLTYVLPPRASRRSTLVAATAVVWAGAVLASMLPLVADGGRVETAAGTFVRGVPLTLRADATGLGIAVLTCGVAVVVLVDARRTALERTGLLVCVGGSVGVCLAGNAVLLVTGLEIGNAGALLMAVSGIRPADAAERRRAQLTFGVQHLASLAMLAASLQLLHAQGTDDLAALPPGAVGTAVALPWAACGAVRLLAAAGLAPKPTRASPGWLPLAALPGGLLVLLRLVEVTGGELGTLAPLVLTTAGLAAALGGGLAAVRSWRRPELAGRALLVSAGGQVVVLAGDGATATTTAAAAVGVALVLAAAAARAWAGEGAPHPALLAASLALAGGLPTGAGTAALLAAWGTEVAPGGARACIGIVAALAGLVAAAAGALAARRALAAGGWSRGSAAAGLDVALAAAASWALAVVPGTFVGGIADRLAGGGGAVTAVDAGAVRGPGFGWAGGYLSVALAVAAVAAAAAAGLQGLWPARPPAEPGGIVLEPALLPAPVGRLPRALPPRLLGVLAGVDRWLVRQPDLPALVLAGLACLAWFEYRP